jgi:hypothetical protein
MASDNEQDQHSIWNGRLKANPKEAKFFLEIIDKLGMQFDGMPVEDILQTFWGEPRDVLEKLIKRTNKRDKKEDTKFTPKDLKRPPTANILFQRDFKIKCDAKGVKFNLISCSEDYKKLSDKEKAKYQKEAARLKDEYTVEYERLRVAAIKSGDFPQDKPKRPLSGFLCYLGDVRDTIAEKYKNEENRKNINAKISKDAGYMWNALSEKDKSKYENDYKKEKEEFDIKMKEWEDTELRRCKKNANANADAAPVPQEVNIETTGAKTTKSAKAPATATSDTEEVEQSKVKATKPAKAPVAAATTSDTKEVEQPKVKATKPRAKVTTPATSVSEEVNVPKAKTKDTKTKPATVIESDADEEQVVVNL